MASSLSFMTKKKKFKFNVKLDVEGLSSVPFVSGVLFAKVHLLSGGSFVAFTDRIEVVDHRVSWQKQTQFVSKLVASVVTGILEPCLCRISIRKELKGGKSYQKLGYVDIDLARYAGAGCTSSCFVLDGYNNRSRQDNSILKITIDMALLSGDPCFKVPAQQKSTSALMTPDDEGGVLHMGNKGGTRVDGDGNDEHSIGHMSNSISVTPDPTSEPPLVKDVPSVQSDTAAIWGPFHGHVRQNSDLSKVSSGYSSGNGFTPTHFRQSSADALLISQHCRSLSIGPPDTVFQCSSIPRATKQRAEGAMYGLAGEQRLNLTRVDHNKVVNDLMNGIDFTNSVSSERSGCLQLYVAKDGTAVLGSARETTIESRSASQTLHQHAS